MLQVILMAASLNAIESGVEHHVLERPDGAKIHWSIRGTGSIPVLMLAPGGMRSRTAAWGLRRAGPYDPLASLPLDRYTLISMDQRHAGASTAQLRDSDGWDTFRDDQIAVLDAAGVRGRCHVLGSCIGPSYALRLLRDHPTRFARAVLMQPIGRAVHTTEPESWDGENEPKATSHWFGLWAEEMLRDRRATPEALNALHARMFGGATEDEFVFSVSRADISRLRIPMLVLAGVDIHHPSEVAREIVRVAPSAKLIEGWRDGDPEVLSAAVAEIEAFLGVSPNAEDERELHEEL